VFCFFVCGVYIYDLSLFLFHPLCMLMPFVFFFHITCILFGWSGYFQCFTQMIALCYDSGGRQPMAASKPAWWTTGSYHRWLLQHHGLESCHLGFTMVFKSGAEIHCDGEDSSFPRRERGAIPWQVLGNFFPSFHLLICRSTPSFFLKEWVGKDSIATQLFVSENDWSLLH
jgi:hypothetical protein